jgi:hypothetical protein
LIIDLTLITVNKIQVNLHCQIVLQASWLRDCCCITLIWNVLLLEFKSRLNLTSMFPMLRAMMSRQCTPDEQGMVSMNQGKLYS